MFPLITFYLNNKKQADASTDVQENDSAADDENRINEEVVEDNLEACLLVVRGSRRSTTSERCTKCMSDSRNYQHSRLRSEKDANQLTEEVRHGTDDSSQPNDPKGYQCSMIAEDLRKRVFFQERHGLVIGERHINSREAIKRHG